MMSKADILWAIDRGSKSMTVAEALKFLEDLRQEIDSRIDAIKNNNPQRPQAGTAPTSTGTKPVKRK